MSQWYYLDVFPASFGGGNQLGVVMDADNIPEHQMQLIAKHFKFVETTFVMASDEADYRVRIFTPEKEIPFAGHPTIGTAFAVNKTRNKAFLTQECGIGIVTIKIKDGVYQFSCPKAKVLATGLNSHHLLIPALEGCYDNYSTYEVDATADCCAKSLGSLPPALVEGGRKWWIVELKQESKLRQWQPNFDAIAKLAKSTGSMGICAFVRTGDQTMVVRAFACGVGINEDPASGAANGILAGYIMSHDPTCSHANGYTVSQGREMGYDAKLVVNYKGGQIWVGGEINCMSVGTLHI